jgi:DNA methylase
MAIGDVLDGRKRFALEQGDCIERMREMPDRSVSLTFGSPPYCDARTYGIGAQRKCLEWVEWMLLVTEQAARVTVGPVFWVVAGVTRGRNYWPACEGLLWEWWKRGGACHLYRPCAWVKTDNDDGGNGIPGSGGDDYLRADWEYVLCFKRPGKLVWSDNTAMGHEPVYDQVGGAMSNRTVEGQRINTEAHNAGTRPWRGPGKRPNGKTKKGSREKQVDLLGESEEAEEVYDPWKTASRGGSSCGGRRKNGEKMQGPKTKTMDVTAGHDDEGNLKKNKKRPMPKIANPGNVVRARVGGGHMGSRLCHEGEAPFPEALAEFFVRSFCPNNVCLKCGLPVQYQHEDKTMPLVQKTVQSNTEREEKILLGGLSEERLQGRNRSDDLCDLREGIQDLGFTGEPKKILQQKMPISKSGQGQRELSKMQPVNTEDAIQRPIPVLFKEVCKPVVGSTSENNQTKTENDEGIHTHSDAEPSNGQQKRVHYGTQIGDGKPSGETLGKGRSCSSRKRKKGRQQTRESGIDDQEATRLSAEAKTANCLPEMRPHDSEERLCMGCGADLSLPGSTRPGIVLDPFSGSGTTAAVAVRWNRRAIGIDLRQSQIDIALRRLEEETPLSLFQD